jgi:hypothetical protein
LSPVKVIKYLGKYIQRVAISNRSSTGSLTSVSNQPTKTKSVSLTKTMQTRGYKRKWNSSPWSLSEDSCSIFCRNASVKSGILASSPSKTGIQNYGIVSPCLTKYSYHPVLKD